MKVILREGAVACAAMLMGANMMAQSFDLVQSFDDVPNTMLMAGFLFNDNESRMMFEIYDEEGFITKKELYEKNLNLDKEITYGPLFEKVEQYYIYEEPKTLKVLEVLVDTNSNYSDDRFYLGDVIYPFYENFMPDVEPNPYYTYIMHYQNMIEDGWSDAKIRGYVEEFIKEWYVEVNYNGERLLFEKHNALKPEKWGMKYPKRGYFYRDHDEIYSVIFRYAADEWQEISRRSYNTYQPSAGFVLYCDNESPVNADYSQGFFNTDDKYEFVIPELIEVGDTSTYYSYYVVHDIEYPYTETMEMTIESEREIRVSYDYMGYKVIAEDGKLLFETEMDPSCSCDLYGYLWAEKKYLVVISAKRIFDEYDWHWGEIMTQFYEIKADGNNTNIQKVREMRGSMNIRPTIANRDEQITITLNEENSNVARELVVTGVNGQFVGRRDIPAGENTVKVNAAMLRSGMYNFTLQKKGQVVDNGKVIVK